MVLFYIYLCITSIVLCYMSIHIGRCILERINQLGITKKNFADRINKSPQNVQDIFNRESIDTALLEIISITLEYNFFDLYYKDSPLKQNQELELLKTKYIELLEKYNELLLKSG